MWFILTKFQDESVLLFASHFLYLERIMSSCDGSHLKNGLNWKVGEFSWGGGSGGRGNSSGCGPP